MNIFVALFKKFNDYFEAEKAYCKDCAYWSGTCIFRLKGEAPTYDSVTGISGTRKFDISAENLARKETNGSMCISRETAHRGLNRNNDCRYFLDKSKVTVKYRGGGK